VLTLLTLLSRAFPGATPFSFKHVAIILLCSIPLSILCAFIIEKVGGGLGGILVWGTSGSFNPEDLFRGEIHKIKYSKREGRFDQALQMVNNLLHEDPDNSEAMLLKAQILWEGFGNAQRPKDVSTGLENWPLKTINFIDGPRVTWKRSPEWRKRFRLVYGINLGTDDCQTNS